MIVIFGILPRARRLMRIEPPEKNVTLEV